MMLTLVSKGDLWFTKWVGNNQFKGFFTSYWLTYRLIGHWCTALINTYVCIHICAYVHTYIHKHTLVFF